MNKNNIGYLHQLIFAVAVIVLVYAGEQVKTKDTGAASWLMRSAAIAASAGITWLTISFIPGAKNNVKVDEKNQQEKSVADLYFYEGVELPYIRKDTVQEIERRGRVIGYMVAEQNDSHKWGMRFTCLSLVSVATAAVLFCVGVCLL